MRVTTNLLIWRRLRKTIAFVNKIYDITNHKLFLPWNLRYKRLWSRLCTGSYRYQLIIQRTFAGSILIMAEFSTTLTYLVKYMQMFLGNVLTINQVSDEWALVAVLLVGVRQWHFETLLRYFIPLFVACTFPCKSKVSFDILEMFHQGTQKELEFLEF